MDVTLTLGTGHFVEDAAVRTAVEDTLSGPLLAGGAILRIAEAAGSPVRTGALRDDWAVGDAPQWDGTAFGVPVFNTMPYATVQDTDSRNAGFAERALSAAEHAALAPVVDGLADFLARLWTP